MRVDSELTLSQFTAHRYCSVLCRKCLITNGQYTCVAKRCWSLQNSPPTSYSLYMPFACDWQTGVIDFAMRQLNFVVCPPALAAARAPQAPQSRTTFRVDRGRRLVAPGVHFSPSPCPDNHLKPGRAPCWAPGSTRATALVEDAPPTAVPLDFWEARGGARGPLPQRPPREASALAATAQ